MTTVEVSRDVMTPQQAASYLQVDRETVYRYIRDGKLAASRLGRSYRIPKPSLELLLWATRTRDDITLRTYSDAQVEEFVRDDRLDAAAQEIVRRFSQANGLPKRG